MLWLGAAAFVALCLLNKRGGSSGRPVGMVIITGPRRREPFPWLTLFLVVGGIAVALASCDTSKPLQTPYSSTYSRPDAPPRNAWREYGQRHGL